MTPIKMTLKEVHNNALRQTAALRCRFRALCGWLRCAIAHIGPWRTGRGFLHAHRGCQCAPVWRKGDQDRRESSTFSREGPDVYAYTLGTTTSTPSTSRFLFHFSCKTGRAFQGFCQICPSLRSSPNTLNRLIPRCNLCDF